MASIRRTTGPVRVSIYARISLDSAGLEAGVERQLQACRDHAERNGWLVTDEYVDNDISAFSGKVRPQFQRMLEAKPEAILCWHMDRLVRRAKDLVRVIDLDLPVYTVTAGLADLSTPAGRMSARILTAVAEMESEHKGERQRLAARQRAEQGRPWWSKQPFGFERDGSHIPEQAAALRQAYADVIAGKSLHSVATAWNAAGLLTNLSHKWSGPTVRRVLLAERNIGMRTYTDTDTGEQLRTRGTWDPIVSDEDFEMVGAILRRPERVRRGRRSLNVLTGIAACGKCGGSIKAGSAQQLPSYKCRDGGCVSWPIERTDAAVLARLAETLADPAFHETWTGFRGDVGTEREALRQERDRLTVRAESLATLLGEGAMSPEQFRAANAPVRARLKAIDATLADVPEAYTLAHILGDFEYVYQELLAMPLEQQREQLRAVFSEIVLPPRGKGAQRFDRSLIRTVPRLDLSPTT